VFIDKALSTRFNVFIKEKNAVVHLINSLKSCNHEIVMTRYNCERKVNILSFCSGYVCKSLLTVKDYARVFADLIFFLKIESAYQKF
jgi:hypothetical protein